MTSRLRSRLLSAITVGALVAVGTAAFSAPTRAAVAPGGAPAAGAAKAASAPAATTDKAGNAKAGNTKAGNTKAGNAKASNAKVSKAKSGKPARVQDQTLRVTPGYRNGRATFRLAGRPATRYTLSLSGQGAATPTTTSISVLTDRAGSGTATIPVTLTGDRTGGIVADIDSTVAGQQRVTSSSVWLHPDRAGTEVVGQSAIDAQLKATANDKAGRAAALSKLAAAPSSERTVTADAQANVASDRIEVHGTARWTDWASTAHPARHIDVQIEAEGAFSYDDRTTTDDNGNYSFDIPAPDTFTDLKVTFQAQNAGAQVGLDGLSDTCLGCFGPYYKTVSASHISGGSSVELDMTAGTNGPWDVSFAMADALWTAYLFGQQVTGSGAESIMVDYPEQIGGKDVGAYTTPGDGRMTIAAREWSAWDVLNHEYGHWFDSKHDISPLIGGTHCVEDNLATAVCNNPTQGRGKSDGTKLAWSEGFADFYSISAAHYAPLPANMPADVGDGKYNDDLTPDNNESFSAASDLSDPTDLYGEDNEFAIAGTLFNLMDPDTSSSVYPEHTGIGVSLVYNTIINAHAQRFSDIVNALWPSDSNSTLLASEQNDFSCMLSAARIAPYWGTYYDPTGQGPLTASLSHPPTITWQAGNGGNFQNNNFVVQALDPSDDLPYFTSAGLTSTSWTPSRGDWDLMTRGRGNSITIRVLGANSDDPYTGFYRGCANTISLPSSAVVNRSDCTAVSLPPNDDGSTGAVSLPFPVDFYGTTYSYLYVNNNGNVTFNAPLGTFTPFTITATTPPIIAPFFADVDTRGTGSAPVTYSYGTTSYGGHQAFCVNWLNVGYFYAHTDKLDSFQLLLVDRHDRGAGDFDIVFNYDSIQWETGDASGGTGGFGGIPAGVGFSAGTGNSSQFFQLPGSMQTHQFTDGDPHALAAGTIGALGTPGRYVFAVANGQPPDSTSGVRGAVLSGGFAVPDAPIQICPHGGGHCIYQTRTGNDGTYDLAGVPAGSYDVTAFPPPGLNASPVTDAAVTVSAGQQATVNLTLNTIAGPPSGTTIGPLEGGGSSSVPEVSWTALVTLSTSGCPGGTASYQVLGLQSGGVGQEWSSGSMPEVSPGQYTTSIPGFFPYLGYAEVDIFIQCPAGTADETVTFQVYVDPSGTVLDQSGQPVEGATVTLLRSDSADGPFVAVPTGSDLMSPVNRTNPVLTGADGRFGWDVVGGYYQVTASKDGCTTAGGGSTVTSTVYDVPPTITGIQLVLNCPVPDTTPPVISTTAVTVEGNTTGGYTGSLPGVTATDPDPGDTVTLTNDAPSVLPLGASTVTWTAVDAAGNRSTATQAVTVVDTTAPVLSCPAGVVGSYPSSPALGNPTVQDVVDAAPVVGNNAPASFPVGVTTVTWTATDHSGNGSSCTQQVTLAHGWTVQPMVTPAGAPSLDGVACPSATSCYAVGWTANGTLAEHWNGSSWSVQSTPGGSGTQLLGVSCSAADACTAVGTDTSSAIAVVERWDGTSWSSQSLPSYVTQLGSVSCASDTSCVAVGYQMEGRVTSEVSASWDGGGWSVQSMPNGQQMLSVSCSAADACTAVGTDTSSAIAVVERWDGTSWSSQSLPSYVTQLGSVSCASDTSCLAVGYQMEGRQTSEVSASWDGGGWSVQSMPNGQQMLSVSCSAADACTAVGTNPSAVAVVERWDGTSWSSQSLPSYVTQLGSVSCASDTSCVAVGYQLDGRQTTEMSASWDGTD